MITHPLWKAVGFAALLSASLISARAGDPIQIIGADDPAALKVPAVTGPEIWKDPSQPVDVRVHDLVSRLSLAEKVSQLSADAIAIPRLGIPAYSYRNEGIHGVVARVGVATVFPQVIGMAATWDAPLIHDEGDVIATEARAHFNDYTRTHNGNCMIHTGISFYAPNINIVRDPRWGRGQETYGEDPFLTAQMGVAFIRGLQGDDPKYLKAIACAKHYAVHSGPEPLRTYFDAKPTERDLYETYLPAFDAAVRQGQVGSVMGAYSELYGVPDCENPFLLTQLLRQRWGFQGFVVSDGGAIMFNWIHHRYEATAEDAAANAVKAGCDLFSGTVAVKGQSDYQALGLMLQKGLLSEAKIDTAISYTLAARFRLGLFDPPALVPWSKITMADNDTPEHRALALKVAQESIVLLKNDGLLPLDRAKIKRIAVIGPNADAAAMLLGNYNGRPSRSVTILDGIRQVAGPNIEVTYTQGCSLGVSPPVRPNLSPNWLVPSTNAIEAGAPARLHRRRRKSETEMQTNNPEMLAQAVAAANTADVVIFVGGIDANIEREGGDRTRIELPPGQENLIKALQATGKPVVLVNCSGSAMAVPWEAKHLPALVQAWYPGEEGGLAVAQVLFGEVNPSGRLPVTFYRSTDDLPDFQDYSMSNRTYRYFTGKPLFAFGHGLSYTKFDYSGAKLDNATIGPDDTMHLSFTVKNTGQYDGDEVAQVYFRHIRSAVPQPKLALCGYTRFHLTKSDATNVTVSIPAKQFRYWDTIKKRYVVEPGKYELLIGAASDDIRLRVPVEVALSQ